MKSNSKHFAYLVRCADDTLYAGYATDLYKRMSEHNGEGETKTAKNAGSKYTRARRPVKLVYSESFESRPEAMKREYAIKQLSRKEKEKLILTVSE